MNALVKVDTLNEVQTFATDVKKFIYDNNMWMKISNKGYVLVDGWSLVGGMLGIRPVVKEIENLSDENTIRYRATVELFNDDKLVGAGVAICTNKEKGKTQFDEYAVLSMAQTRAVGKAYRLNIGWIMKLAGFETTPAEEMDSVDTTVSEDKLKKIVEEYQDGNDK